MKKYISKDGKDGKVGVIVSPGFGAGWSTWSDDSDFFCMDKTLVEMKLNESSINDVRAYIQKETGKDAYMGGWDDAKVLWLKKGTKFTIEEYDGSETLRLIEDLTMTA